MSVIAFPKRFLFRITERVSPHEMEFESSLLVVCSDEWTPSDVMEEIMLRWQRRLLSAPWRKKQPPENRMAVVPATQRMINLTKIDYSELDIREFEIMKDFIPGIDWSSELPRSKQTTNIEKECLAVGNVT